MLPDSKAWLGKVHDELRTSCQTRKSGSSQNMMEISQKDTEANQNVFSLAKSGTIQASKYKIIE
jgi:hypothetical protein